MRQARLQRKQDACQQTICELLATASSKKIAALADCPHKPTVPGHLRTAIECNEFRLTIGGASLFLGSQRGCTVPALLLHFLRFRMGHARYRADN